MILVDASAWIDHLWRDNEHLHVLLERNWILGHPLVIGEVACGSIKRRDLTLALLNSLPKAPLVDHHEVAALLEANQLWGRGLGWIDIHLLASARLAHAELWTFDHALASAAALLDVGH